VAGEQANIVPRKSRAPQRGAFVPVESPGAPPLPADPALDEATLAARTVDKMIPIPPMAHTASF